jgi:PASTA domain
MIRVEMKKRLLLVVALGVLAGACTRPLHSGISNVWLLAGDPGANLLFCRHPEGTSLVACLPLSSIAPSIPAAWPSPPRASAACGDPYKIIVNFADRTRLVYGPCVLPPEIVRLHDAMLKAALDLGAPVSVPNVLYLSVDDARRALAAVGLSLGEVQVVMGAYPVGVVIEQHPRANRMAARGSGIRVVIGSGNG